MIWLSGSNAAGTVLTGIAGQADPEKEISSTSTVCTLQHYLSAQICHIYWGGPQLPHETFHFKNALRPILYKLQGREEVEQFPGWFSAILTSCSTVTGINCYRTSFYTSGICSGIFLPSLKCFHILAHLHESLCWVQNSTHIREANVIHNSISTNTRPQREHPGAFPLSATPQCLRHTTKATLYHAANNNAPWINFHQAPAINT